MKAKALLAGVVGVVMALGASGSAQAAGESAESAFGSQPVRSFDFSIGDMSFTVPSGCVLSHYISGRGRTVEAENMGTDCAGIAFLFPGFCNYRLNFRYYDTDGNLYAVNEGPLQERCERNTFRTIKMRRVLEKAGRSCATLLVNGQERARQCHSIMNKR